MRKQGADEKTTEGGEERREEGLVVFREPGQ